MKKLQILIVLLFMVGISYALPNPAAVYCKQMGYTYNIIKTPQGERGECIFSANEKCDDWDFLSGKCGQNYSYCVKNGYDIKTVSDGKGKYSYDYAVCVPKIQTKKETPVTDFITLGSDVKISETTIEQISKTQASSAVSATSLPSYFDWRNVNGYNGMTPVKDQGGCGSCWDFAAVGAAEAKIKIENNSPSINQDLSEQDVLSCSDAGDCRAGGYSDQALTYIQNTGVVDEDCFPYTGIDANGCDYYSCPYAPVPCSNKCSDWQNRTFKIAASSLPSYDWKKDLIERGPLVSFLDILDGYFDSNNIFKCDSPLLSNHLVVIVGYNDPGRYWIIKNSWGSTWNGDGYFKLYYGNCSIRPIVYAYASTEKTLTNAVTDLSILPLPAAVKLSWTSISEGGVLAGTLRVDHYTIKYSTSPITESNFDALPGVSIVASSPGVNQSDVIAGLNPGTTYNFAVKAYDIAEKSSSISNLVSSVPLSIPSGCDFEISPPYTITQSNKIYCLPGDVIAYTPPGRAIDFAGGVENTILDCRGFQIYRESNFDPRSFTAIGVGYNSPGNNLTIKNCKITNFTVGMSIVGTPKITIINNTAYNDNTGFYTIYSNAKIINNTAYNISEYGFFISDSSQVQNNVAYNSSIGFFMVTGNATNNVAYNNKYGFQVQDADLKNNTAYKNTYGFYIVRYSSSGSLVNNTAYSNTRDGFLVEASNNKNLINNSAYGNSNGFSLTGMYSSNLTLTNNTAYNNLNGFNIWLNNTKSGSPIPNNLTKNTAYNNAYGGFYLYNSSLFSLTSNTAYNNGDGFYMRYSPNNNLTNDIANNNWDAGFNISLSQNVTFLSNTANTNTYGFSASLSSVVIANNTATGNTKQDFLASSCNVTNFTTLNYSISPPSGTANQLTIIHFACGYYDFFNTPVSGAGVNVVIDGQNYTATYSLSDYTYHLDKILSAGTHSWYCNASKIGYQLQIGSTQTYLVQSTGGGGGGGCGFRGCLLTEPTEQMPLGNTWTLAVELIAIIGLAIGYFIMREVIFTATTKTRKK